MKSLTKRTLFLLILFLNQKSFTSSGANFLKVGIGARAMGLSSAYTAVVDDVTAIYWNPAGLAKLSKREAGTMHAELYLDTRSDFAGYAHPTKIGTFAIGVSYFSYGTLEGRGELREKKTDFYASDMAVFLGYAKANVIEPSFFNLRPLSLGITTKFVQSQISEFYSQGYAFDIGIQSSLNNDNFPLLLGISIHDIGPEMKYIKEDYELPMVLASGIALPYNKTFLISSDFKYYLYNEKINWSIGTEYSPISLFALRTGYGASDTSSSWMINRNIKESLSSLSGLGLGFGIKLNFATLDYSVTPLGEVGYSQRISLSARF